MRLAAAEVGLKLYHRVATLTRNALHPAHEQAPRAATRFGGSQVQMIDQPLPRHRALAAFLSFLFPGLGQAYAGHRRLAALLALPVALLILAVLVALAIGGRQIMNSLLSASFLTALIGLPGIGVYLAGRALGVTAEVVTVPQNVYWWTAVVLVLAALQNGVLEEVLVVGYLFTRLRQLGWGPWAILWTSAVLRGSYHLYQGFGQALGNLLMGLVFGYVYQRTGRLAPLVVAHTLLDVFAFVGVLVLGDELGLG